MRVYFVRHGQSELNASGTHQGAEGALSSAGRQQAHYVGEKLKQFSIDAIIHSPFERTHETAEVIRETLGHADMQTTELLREIVPPSSLQGMEHHHEKSIAVRAQIRENQQDHDWRYEDEETVNEIIDRCHACLKYLSEQPHENMVVVSHGSFMKCLFATVLLGDLVTSEVFHRFRQNLDTANTGVCILDYRDSQWRVLTWNDFAHINP